MLIPAATRGTPDLLGVLCFSFDAENSSANKMKQSWRLLEMKLREGGALKVRPMLMWAPEERVTIVLH